MLIRPGTSLKRLRLHQEKKKRANDLPMVPTTCQRCQRRANGAIFACPKIWHQIFDSRCQLTAISTNRAIRTNSNYRANTNYYKF